MKPEAVKPGMLIVFEGIDGSGTTTQAKMLAEWFAGQGRPVHLTWEPSQGRIGRLLREHLSGRVDAPDPERWYHALALLFAADRLDHLAREIEPRRAEGVHVISDRYLLSSFVYQSLHCDLEWVRQINHEAPAPDLTFLLDLPTATAMERLARRNLFTAPEIYETAEQQEKLRLRYLRAAQDLYSEHKIVTIDALASQDQVHAQVLAQLAPRLSRAIK
jgi:dTMP kinase